MTGPVTYTVTITDELGCVAQAQVQLGIHPTHAVTAYWDQVIELGSMAQLQAVGEGSFVWAPAGSLSDSTSATPVAQPQQSTTYTVTLTDVNGCITTDEVTVLILVVSSSRTPSPRTAMGTTMPSAPGALTSWNSNSMSSTDGAP